jgi:hypothetical protein
VLAYATNVMKTLGMAQWVVIIMHEPCSDDANASVEWVDGRYVAQIRLSQDWMQLRDEVRRNVITHEILHLVHCRVSDSIDEGRDLMHAHEWSPYRRRIQRETELMVDHFATFMADTHRLVDAWHEAHGRSVPDHRP